MQLRTRDVQTVELQMGPMIDMVFLLLVFFMVTAKPIKPESDIGLSLPGTVAQEETLEIPDEQKIAITGEGAVLLNEMTLAAPGDRQLPALVTTLKRFKRTAEANKAEALVTVEAADAATHQRIVDVLNACAKAEVTNVTFSDAADLGEDW